MFKYEAWVLGASSCHAGPDGRRSAARCARHAEASPERLRPRRRPRAPGRRDRQEVRVQVPSRVVLCSRAGNDVRVLGVQDRLQRTEIGAPPVQALPGPGIPTQRA